MSTRPKPEHAARAKFKPGDWIKWGGTEPFHLALVVEDCGIAGESGNRYYRLREYPLWTDVREYELSERHLEPAARPDKLPEPHDTHTVP